ncbi:hypothetical protein HNY73_007419 [Argiope bruennichi]|uniref:Mutator-like transposase domain-containing protein n=1 Tax=Argiope bruennichi TaxID=94029 RepID=A0A8T0FEI3_ARGBR|nr:hypothetical protein HNY73_007419 [Argiope bruennichi]
MVKALKPTDKPLHKNFCVKFQEKLDVNGFENTLVFTDDAMFHLCGKAVISLVIHALLQNKHGQFYEVNRRVVYAMRQIGCGHREASQFMTVMNMPPPPNPVPYNKHMKALLCVVKPLAEETMRLAAYRVRLQNETSKCGVSVDGTWHKRGYSSLNGVVTDLSVDTGEVLGVEILSKDCIGCRKWNKKDKSSVEYQLWKADHICCINYHGSSNNMEPIGTGRIFQRIGDLIDSCQDSETLHNLTDELISIVRKSCKMSIGLNVNLDKNCTLFPGGQ